jgi:hypothetical protein
MPTPHCIPKPYAIPGILAGFSQLPGSQEGSQDKGRKRLQERQTFSRGLGTSIPTRMRHA